jgi:hypothetical protein
LKRRVRVSASPLKGKREMKLEVGKIYKNSYGIKFEIISSPSTECKYFAGVIHESQYIIPTSLYYFHEDGKLVGINLDKSFDLKEEVMGGGDERTL